MIVTTAGQRGFGILRNFSSSGGYIETTLSLAPLAPVDLELHVAFDGPGQERNLSGFVVRRDSCGLGIEWSDAVEMAATDIVPAWRPHFGAQTAGARAP